MASGLSGPWLTANSALVPDGSSHKADGRVSAPTSGYNDYTPIDAGREPVGLGEALAGSGNRVGRSLAWRAVGGAGSAGLWPGSWEDT